MNSREMPKYRSHKIVWALKIKEISEYFEDENNPESYGALIYPEEKGYAAFRVDKEYLEKHKPKAGGYYVVYEDGYKSFSPAEPFEKGYSKI